MTPVEFTERELKKLIADVETDLQNLDRLVEKVRLSTGHGSMPMTPKPQPTWRSNSTTTTRPLKRF